MGVATRPDGVRDEDLWFRGVRRSGSESAGLAYDTPVTDIAGIVA
jgi:hypothetical protein